MENIKQYVIMKEPPDKNDDYFKSIKVLLKYVLKNDNINQEKINNLFIKAHKIVINKLQFIKLYIRSL